MLSRADKRFKSLLSSNLDKMPCYRREYTGIIPRDAAVNFGNSHCLPPFKMLKLYTVRRYVSL